MDYSDRKHKTKCSKLGGWRKGVPAPHGKLECPLNGGKRLHLAGDRSSQNATEFARRHATKSVKIDGYESCSYLPSESSAPEPDVPSRRPSSESASVESKRFSTGPERTTVMSDESPCSAPLRETTATTPTPAQKPVTTSTRQKAYHFDDEPAPCDADMNRTARALVSHEPHTRRNTVLSHRPIPVDSQVQNVNYMTTPIFRPPATASPPILRGVVVGVQGDSALGAEPAVSVVPVPRRTSSLTHVVPPTDYPRRSLTSFYPDFLRKRVTPARHDVAAEEVDKELLVNARDTDGVGREFVGLSAEIREFAKYKDGSTPKDETWIRLAEMAGFPWVFSVSPKRG